MELSDETKINAMLIVEVVGRPAEHLTETLKEIIGKIKEENKVEIIKEKIMEPHPLKENQDFFTNFAEIEVEVEEISILIELMFKYMPAHVEIISPEKITLSNHVWSEVLSELIRKLHGYDEVARIVETEKKILEKKLRDILEKNKIENKEDKSEKEEDSGK